MGSTSELKNLILEFYFTDEVLNRCGADGKQALVFKLPEIKAVLASNQTTMWSIPNTHNETRQIIDGKKKFAEEVVPHLPIKEFEPFMLIFNKIETIFTHIGLTF